MILKRGLSVTSCRAIVQMMLAGATWRSRDVPYVIQAAMPEDTLVNQIIRQCEKAKLKPLVKWRTFEGQSCWMFSIEGYAMVADWIDRGYDMLGKPFSVQQLAMLRPALRLSGERVRKVLVDDLKR